MESPRTVIDLLRSQRLWIGVVSALGFLVYGEEYNLHWEVPAIAAGIVAVVTFFTSWVRPFAARSGNFWSILLYKPLWAAVVLIGAMVAAVAGKVVDVDPEAVAGAIVIIVGVIQASLANKPPTEPVG